MRLISPVRTRGFTLLEICLAIFIAVLLVTLAVPSVSGLLAEQKLKRSFEAFDAMAQEAENRAVTERRAYVIAWEKEGLNLIAKEPANKDELNGVKQLEFAEKESFDLTLPAALMKDPAREWIFWPTGTCEPATIVYHGAAGQWNAVYDPLTVRAQFTTQ